MTLVAARFSQTSSWGKDPAFYERKHGSSDLSAILPSHALACEGSGQEILNRGHHYISLHVGHDDQNSSPKLNQALPTYAARGDRFRGVSNNGNSLKLMLA
jgi:hypothetical protein